MERAVTLQQTKRTHLEHTFDDSSMSMRDPSAEINGVMQ